MRRALLTLLLLMCLTPAAHAAQGMNLAWDACFGDGGVRNKTFACDTNTGSEQLYVSFQLDSAFTPVTGMELTINFSTPAGPPGAWWQFKNAGSCRLSALSASSAPLTPGGSCVNYWNGFASGGIAGYTVNYVGLGMNRLFVIFALPSTAWASLDGDVEYFAARLAISHANSVGAGSCPGCLDPVCIGIENLKLTRPVGQGDIRLAEETTFGSSTVNWQGSAASSSRVGDPARFFYRTLHCASATAARNPTWGSIKSLYH